MSISLRPIAAGAAVLALSIAAAAWAQPAPPPASDSAGAPAGAHFDREAMRARMEARRQERLQTLHDALGLRADQDGAWRAYVDGMRQPEGREGRDHRDHARGEGPMTTPERLDRMAQRMSEHQAAFQRRAETIKGFYAALSPTQQRTFDALGRLRMGGRGMGGHEHGGFGHDKG